MDDTKKSLLTSVVLTLTFLSAVCAHAIEVEYISLEKKTELEKQFEAAKLEASDSGKLEGKKWSCDMYGVRSRLQVQRNIKLYSLKRDDLGALQNTGAQVISSYSPFEGALQGKNERFEDQIRMTSDGQLVSRLSLRGETPTIIAYSICKSL